MQNAPRSLTKFLLMDNWEINEFGAKSYRTRLTWWLDLPPTKSTSTPTWSIFKSMHLGECHNPQTPLWERGCLYTTTLCMGIGQHYLNLSVKAYCGAVGGSYMLRGVAWLHPWQLTIGLSCVQRTVFLYLLYASFPTKNGGYPKNLPN